MLVMASVLYPYIYMVTRIAFRLTPASLFEIALVHNQSQFWKVGLPLARPAIMAGSCTGAYGSGVRFWYC